MSNITLGIDDVQVIDSLYPRLRVDWDKVHDYGEVLHDLPAIVVARGSVLVDGWHRLEAHKRAGQTGITADDLGDLTDDQILAESIRLNVIHGNALSRKDRQALAVRLWPALTLTDQKKVEHLAKLLAVSDRTVKRWVEPLREAERKAEQDAQDAKKSRAVELHEAGWSQRRIAKELGVDQATVARWLMHARQMSDAHHPDDQADADEAQPADAATDEAACEPEPEPEPEPLDHKTRQYLEEWSDDGDLVAAVVNGSVTIPEAVATAQAREQGSYIEQEDGDPFTGNSPASQALAKAIRLLVNFLDVSDDGFHSPDPENWRVMRALIPEVNQRINQWKEAADERLG